MKLPSLAITIYSLFCLLGGLMGYIKAESGISLLVGGGSGIVLYVAARAINRGSRLAAYIALFVSLAIGIRFGLTYLSTMQVFPHLLMLILSVISIIACLLSLRQRRASA